MFDHVSIFRPMVTLGKLHEISRFFGGSTVTVREYPNRSLAGVFHGAANILERMTWGYPLIMYVYIYICLIISTIHIASFSEG